jgi:hypothetical protein
MPDDFTGFREKLDDRIDAGGCAETWAAVQRHREPDHDRRPAESQTDLAGPSTSRRSVLKSAGATASASLVGTLLADPAAAFSGDARRSIQSPPETELTVEEANGIVDTYAGELLESLAERGYLDEAHPAGLNYNAVQVGGRRSRDTLRVSTATHPDEGEYMTLSTRLPAPEYDRDIIVSVRPELDQAAASTDLDGSPLVLRSDTDGFVTQEFTGWCEPCVGCRSGSGAIGLFPILGKGELQTAPGYVSICGSCRAFCGFP